MTCSVFKTYFDLFPPSLGSKISYGVTHFFNRARSYADWESFSVIRAANDKQGEVLLGQITIDSFHNTLTKKLNNGLVVSCNDCFELSGVGSLANVIPPHSWSYYNITHHHLPFTDFSDNASPLLIIQTLQKMQEVHNNKEAIYIHCKAGRSRSAFLASLFLCITDQDIKQQLLNAKNDACIESIYMSSIQKLQQYRPQVGVGKDKIALGVGVLKKYIKYWNGATEEIELFDRLNKNDSLSMIAQSSEYKFLWQQAYKNPDIFPIIQLFAKEMYLQAEKEENQAFDIDELIHTVLINMTDDKRAIIQQLHFLYVASEELMEQIWLYPENIQSLGIDVLNKVLKSAASYKKKTEWLTQTIAYLKDPVQQLDIYTKKINSDLINQSPALQIIGSAMMVLGVALIMVALLAGCLATGGFGGVAMAMLGAAGLGGFEIGIGKLVYNYGSSDGVAQSSYQLVNQVQLIEPNDNELSSTSSSSL